MTTRGAHFIDAEGRRLLLRGVNVGGSSKVPTHPPGATHLSKGFYDHRSVSFVGRPFPLDEAREHFELMREWGFTVIRLLVTWEAVEHAGPGTYDRAYLDYLADVVEQASTCDIDVIIDFHQDCYSRFTGGDGAPGWTLELAGMDLRRMDETGAAITHQMHRLPFEKMVWTTNAQKLGAATMFTLFFAGNDFAPEVAIDGTSLQDFLQEHYREAITTVARRLSDLPNVIGYDLINEPSPGYIACGDLTALPAEPRIGAIPTPLQSMALGAGIPQEVEVFRFGATGSRRSGTRVLNPEGASLWLKEGACIWRAHGVWEPASDGSPRLLKPDYFRTTAGRTVDFNEDYYLPFLRSCTDSLRSVHPSCLVFLQPAVGVGHIAPLSLGRSRVVSAPHWYDGTLLMLKDFVPWLGADSLTRRPVFGTSFVRRSFARQIETLTLRAGRQAEELPTLIGEVGIPFDRRRRKRGPTSTVDEDSRAMDRSLRALDDNLASYTIWNYTADNDEAHGDQWNEEDLSIYSRQKGGRALDAVVRPYARAVSGTPRRMRFDLESRRFELLFEGDAGISAPTELFVPTRHYPGGIEVRLSDGRYEYLPEKQLLRFYPATRGGQHSIDLRPSPT